MLRLGLFCALFPTFLFAGTEYGYTDRYFYHRGPGPLINDKNFGNEIIYQVFVDRFANGNATNDCIEGGRYCAQGREDFPWYHYQGGDLRGLIQKTDYLKELGVTRLWLTPIFENAHVDVEVSKFGRQVRPTSYHGYWFRDWFRLNPYFTDKGKEDFEIVDELIESAWPMRIYLDTVVNHTSPADASPSSLDFLQAKEPLPSQARFPHRGAIFRDGRFITNLGDEIEKTQNQYGYTPWFHPWDRKIENWSSQWEVENLQLDRLSDLNQDSPELGKYMLDAHKFWLERFPKLAGYRIDTIKHVPLNYWLQFSRELYHSFPRQESFGEFWDGGALGFQTHDFYQHTRFSMLDFDFRYALLDVFGKSNASFSRITELWQQDPLLSDASQMITFLDNHDFPRARGMSGFTKQRFLQAAALWLVSRGIPCIYYGMEQDLFFPGDPGDPFNRPMMTTFDTAHSDFEFFKRLIALRKSNLAARHGLTHVVHETNNIIVFERNYGRHNILFATSKNPTKSVDRFKVRNLLFPDGVYQNLMQTISSGSVFEVNNGELELTLRKGDIVILHTN